MSRMLSSIVVTILLFVSTDITAQQNKPSKSLEPSWVTKNDYQFTKTSLDKDAEDGSVDLAQEIQVNLKEHATYHRKAYKILNTAGAQNNSEISVSFDPSYSSITFHSIRILRGDKVFNQLNLAKIKTIQQEKELARHSYDGSLSAVLFLEDVRKGDIIDYSYTIHGFNPVFKNKYAYFFETSFAVPVYNLYYKVIVPQGRHINIKNSLIDIQPNVNNSAEGTTYEWKLSGINAVKVQDDVPSWYDGYSMIMVSEFNNWTELNQWAQNLFPKTIQLSASLKSKVEEIKTEEKNDEGRILRALRFVQDDIRYMGVEMGVNSHQPASPNRIFIQRFGDCKDKSYLLSSMLQEMGIDASPVLINTTYKKTINDWLPAPTDFDHVTVRIKCNGKYYWLDPTIAYQRGKLENISYPDYQTGLVITDSTTSLTTIPFHEPGITNVKEVFDITNMRGNATLTVTTEYSGSFADDMRSSFNEHSISEMEGYGEKFYSDYFDKIESDSITFTDDESTGILTTKEYYSIGNIWETKLGKKKASFQPYVILWAMNKPSDDSRTAPYALTYPAKYKEEIDIKLPDEWSGEETEHNIQCSAFKFKSRYFYTYHQFHLIYNYESLKDYIDADESEEYSQKYKKTNSAIAYELSLPSSGVDTVSSLPSSPVGSSGGRTLIILSVIVIGVIVWIVRRV